jgi:hypothetical protein
MRRNQVGVVPTDWIHCVTHDGFLVHPPAGAGRAVVRLRRRCRPLVAMRDLTEELARRTAESASDVRVVERRRVITDEGEYAAIAQLAATGASGPIEASVGAIFGDDFYYEVLGAASAPEHAETVRALVDDLVRTTKLGLGRPRRRWFEYPLPVGWRGLARELATEWYAPGFPHCFGVITVPPARALAESPEPDAGETERIATQHLEGEWRRMRDDTRAIEQVVLADRAYRYTVRLDSDLVHLEYHRAVLRAIVDGIRPLPEPKA